MPSNKSYWAVDLRENNTLVEFITHGHKLINNVLINTSRPTSSPDSPIGETTSFCLGKTQDDASIILFTVLDI